MSLVRDLLAGPGNHHWDLGRIASAWGFVMFTGALVWKAIDAQDINLIEVGTGYAALFAGAGALISLKDRSHVSPSSGAAA